MAKPYDATPKHLIGLQPEAWLRLLGIEAENVKVCNVDLSTVSSDADALLLYGVKRKQAAHIEFQSTYKADIGDRALWYNVTGRRKLKVPVRSYVVLLRPDADGPALSGIVSHIGDDGKLDIEFHYQVLRVWQLSAEKLSTYGIGVLPLAFIADIQLTDLPALVRKAQRTLSKVKDAGKAGEIWTSIRILMGLRFNSDFITLLLKGVQNMEESTTYQEIKAIGKKEGKAEGVREILVRLGTHQFGPPPPRMLNALNAIGSLERLEELTIRILEVSSWRELLK